MYNPNQCDDSYCEWIELYNEGDDIDITNWTLCGKKILAGYVNRNGDVLSNETLTIPSGGYAIITDGGTGTEVYGYFNVSGISLHVDARSACGGLSAGKTIFLNESSRALISSALINSSIGADNNGKSLQFNGTEWLESMPTPGASNIFPAAETNGTNPSDENQTMDDTIVQITNTTNETSSCLGYNYSVDAPAELSENLTVRVKIENCENETDFELWSYVYSASQCYSIGGREANMINISVSKEDSKTTELRNQLNLSEISSGRQYKLKVKILRQGLQTPNEFTFDLASENFSFSANDALQENENEGYENMTENNDVPANASEESKENKCSQFESKSENISDTAVYIFAGILMALSIYLILKKA